MAAVQVNEAAFSSEFLAKHEHVLLVVPAGALPGLNGNSWAHHRISNPHQRLLSPHSGPGRLGALSALAACDWDVQTLAPSPRPLSLNVLGISENTWRKTTAWQMIWEPHLHADEEVEDTWTLARRNYENAPAGEGNHYARPRVSMAATSCTTVAEESCTTDWMTEGS